MQVCMLCVCDAHKSLHLQAHMLFVVLVCFALESFDQKWSAFGPSINETHFIHIPRRRSFQEASKEIVNDIQ